MFYMKKGENKMNTFELDGAVKFILPDNLDYEITYKEGKEQFRIIEKSEQSNPKFKCLATIAEYTFNNETGYTKENLLDELCYLFEATYKTNTYGKYPMAFCRKTVIMDEFWVEIKMNVFGVLIRISESKVLFLDFSLPEKTDYKEKLHCLDKLLEVIKSIYVDNKKMNIDDISSEEIDQALEENNDENFDVQELSDDAVEKYVDVYIEGLDNAIPDESLYQYYNLKYNGMTTYWEIGGNNTDISICEVQGTKSDFSLYETAKAMTKIFYVEDDEYDPGDDRETEFDVGIIRSNYLVSALRSFAWTLAAYCDTNDCNPANVDYFIIGMILIHIKNRNWLNYEDKSYCKGLCSGRDVNVYYTADQSNLNTKQNVIHLPNGQILKVDKNTNIDFDSFEQKYNVQSLDELRKDLEYIYPAIARIYLKLLKNRNYSEQLQGIDANILYAWISFALAAKSDFYTEHLMYTDYDYSGCDRNCDYDGYTTNEDDKDLRGWMKKYESYFDRSPNIEFAGSKFVLRLGYLTDIYAHEIMKRDGLVRQQVSGVTDYLIVEPFNNSQLNKAIEKNNQGKNIKIILFEDFLKVLDRKDPDSVVFDYQPQDINTPFLKEIDLGAIVFEIDKQHRLLGIAKKTEKLNVPHLVLCEDIISVSKTTFTEFPEVKSVGFSHGVKYIGNHTFHDYLELEFVLLPETIYKIGDYAFSGTSLKEIVIPEGCEEIGEYCFKDCRLLKDIYIPSSIKKIGENAFCTGNNQTILHIKDNPYVQKYAIENGVNVDALEQISDADSYDMNEDQNEVDYFYDENDCNNKIVSALQLDFDIEDVFNGSSFYEKEHNDMILYEDETNLDSYIFNNGIKLKYNAKGRLILPASLKSLSSYSGSWDFEGSWFKEIYIPNTIDYSTMPYGSQGFWAESDSLPRIHIVNIETKTEEVISYTEFKKRMRTFKQKARLDPEVEFLDEENAKIYDCSTKIIVPKNIKNIEHSSFKNDLDLEEIILPNNLEKIGRYAFSNCRSLRYVWIPENIKEIQESAFLECINLLHIFIPDTLNLSNVGKNAFFTHNKDTFIHVYNGKNHIIRSIPISEMGYKNDGFDDTVMKYFCSKKINIDKSLDFGDMWIDFSCFYNLEEVHFKGAPLDTCAFKNCINLQKAYLLFDDVFAALEESAFENCGNLEEVYIYSDEIIDIMPFAFQNCLNLKHVYLYIKDKLSGGIDELIDHIFLCEAFDTRNEDTLIHIHYRDEPERTIKVSDYNSKFVNNSEEYSVQNIFQSEQDKIIDQENTNFLKIVLPNDLTFIISNLFKGLMNIKTICVPKRVSFIGDAAFKDCLNLQEIYVPSTLKKKNIGKEAFSTGNPNTLIHVYDEKNNVESLNVSDYLNRYLKDEEIEEDLSIDNPNALIHENDEENKVETLNTSNRHLNDEKVEEKIEYDRESSTSDIRLEQLVLPSNINYVPTNAYSGSEFIKAVFIPENVSSIGDFAFKGCRNLKDIYIPITLKTENVGKDAFNTGNPDTLIHIYNKNGDPQETTVKVTRYVYQKAKKDTKVRNQEEVKRSKSKNKSKSNLKFYILMIAILIAVVLMYSSSASKDKHDYRDPNIIEGQNENEYDTLFDCLETGNVFYVTNDADQIYLENKMILSLPRPTNLSQNDQEKIDRLYEILQDEQSLLSSNNLYMNSPEQYNYLAEKNLILLNLASDNTIYLTKEQINECIDRYFTYLMYQLDFKGSVNHLNKTLTIKFQVKNNTGFDIHEIWVDVTYHDQNVRYTGYNIKNNDDIYVEVNCRDYGEPYEIGYTISYIEIQ